MTTNTTPTPRTDAAAYILIADGSRVVDYDVSAQLERELAECREKNLWCNNEILKLQRELAEAKEELDRVNMRLVACDVVAMSDTPESAVKARDMHSDYKSAALESVIRRVDECIKLRDALTAAQERAEKWEEAVRECCIVDWADFNPDDPLGTIQGLCAWNAQIALDPKVSAAAAELRDTYKERAEKWEKVASDLVGLLRWNQSAYAEYFEQWNSAIAAYDEAKKGT